MDIIAHILGFSAMALSFYSATLKDDQKLIIYQIFVNFLFIPHFILLGSYSTALVVTFIMFRIIAAYKYNNNLIYSLFMASGVLQLCYVFYSHLPWFEYLPVLSSILVTHTYFKLRGIPMRITFIAGGVLWIIAAINLNSPSVALINFVGILIHCSTIFRLSKENEVKSASTAPT